MDRKLSIGIIGAGTISAYHIRGYQACSQAVVSAICDVNPEAAKARAGEFDIPRVYSDYRELLAAPGIEAVSIVTPTFTHKQMVLAALAAGKHVLCEKPPCLTVTDVEECNRAAEEAGKLLMFGFVVRQLPHVQYLKQFVDGGNMGEIYFAEVNRVSDCKMRGGWFNDKQKAGGGDLFDGCIHEIDAALYLMGYPKLKSVKGYTTNVHNATPYLVAGEVPEKRTTESGACALATFENGACMQIRAGHAFFTPEENTSLELCGKKAGAFVHTFKQDLKLLQLDENNQMVTVEPELESGVSPHHRQTAHFVDCCLNGTECMVKPWQAVEVMKLLCAIYESAETGHEIQF